MEKKAEHTAGPWVCEANGLITCNGQTIAVANTQLPLANQILLAQAPKLLQWIQVLLDQVDYTSGACSPTEMVGAVLDRSVVAQALAEIAKARGIHA